MSSDAAAHEACLAAIKRITQGKERARQLLEAVRGGGESEARAKAAKELLEGIKTYHKNDYAALSKLSKAVTKCSDDRSSLLAVSPAGLNPAAGTGNDSGLVAAIYDHLCRTGRPEIAARMVKEAHDPASSASPFPIPLVSVPVNSCSSSSSSSSSSPSPSLFVELSPLHVFAAELKEAGQEGTLGGNVQKALEWCNDIIINNNDGQGDEGDDEEEAIMMGDLLASLHCLHLLQLLQGRVWMAQQQRHQEGEASDSEEGEGHGEEQEEDGAGDVGGTRKGAVLIDLSASLAAASNGSEDNSNNSSNVNVAGRFFDRALALAAAYRRERVAPLLMHQQQGERAKRLSQEGKKLVVRTCAAVDFCAASASAFASASVSSLAPRHPGPDFFSLLSSFSSPYRDLADKAFRQQVYRQYLAARCRKAAIAVMPLGTEDGTEEGGSALSTVLSAAQEIVPTLHSAGRLLSMQQQQQQGQRRVAQTAAAGAGTGAGAGAGAGGAGASFTAASTTTNSSPFGSLYSSLSLPAGQQSQLASTVAAAAVAAAVGKQELPIDHHHHTRRHHYHHSAFVDPVSRQQYPLTHHHRRGPRPGPRLGSGGGGSGGGVPMEEDDADDDDESKDDEDEGEEAGARGGGGLVLLLCGHVVSKDTARALAQARASSSFYSSSSSPSSQGGIDNTPFKCPTCPQINTLREVLPLFFA